VVLVFGVAGWAAAQNPAVHGTGAPGTVPLWTSKDTLGNSSITQSDNGDQTINGSLSVMGNIALPNAAPNAGVISIGGVPVLYILPPSFSCGPPAMECGRNIFLGPSAGNFTSTGFSNTATGDGSLDSITTGTQNTATGTFSLFSNTTGIGNTAAGVDALRSNTIGGSNTATGHQAMILNTTGGANTATGNVALASNTTGFFNTATGQDALLFNTTGSWNTAMGRGALLGNTTGSFNTAIGAQAGFAGIVINGDYNIYVGYAVAGPSNESNTIRIGNGNDNRAFIAGIYGVPTGLPGTAVFVDANGQLGTVSSSARFKFDVQDMGDASSDLMKLRPVTFRYKQAQEDGSHPLQYGLVAEEVAEVNPGLVQFDKDGQPQTVLYHVLPALLLNEVQKEHQKIEDQQKLIQAQQEQLKAQEERLRKLEAILSSKTN
jgi:hypothetical protein